MSKIQALLAALAGVTAALPGIAAIGDFDVPGGSAPLFAFALSVSSSAAVLAAYTLRKRFASLKTAKFIGLVAVFGGIACGLFAGYVWVSNNVLVTHEWRSEAESQFVPLFLPDTLADIIDEAGSRRSYIMKFGPDSFIDITTEENVTVTLLVMILVYGALVAAVAVLFTVLAVRALEET